MEKEAINKAIAQFVGKALNFYDDLNAMHEAEELLSIEQKENFVAFLANAAQMKRTKATINSDYFIVVHATAAQRAEALLCTIAKWTA